MEDNLFDKMKFLLFSTFVACVLAGAYADLPRDVLTLLEDGRVGKCSATENSQGVALSCQIQPALKHEDKMLMNVIFPGETPITYAEFIARVRNPSGVSAATAEAPVPKSADSAGYVKQELQTSNGPVPVLSLVATEAGLVAPETGLDAPGAGLFG